MDLFQLKESFQCAQSIDESDLNRPAFYQCKAAAHQEHNFNAGSQMLRRLWAVGCGLLVRWAYELGLGQ